MVEEELFKNDAFLTEGGNSAAPLLSLNTTVKPVNVPALANKNAIPEVRYLLDADVSSTGLHKLPVPSQSGLSPIDTLLGPAGIGANKDVRVHIRRDRVPVAVAERGVAVPNRLHVLLRHRLLRRAHRRERVGTIGEVLDLCDLAVAKPVDRKDATGDLDSARPRVAREPAQCDHGLAVD